MTLSGDAKLQKKRTGGLRNDSRNLVNFHASSQKSENLHSDRDFLSIVYKVSAEKVQKSYLSWLWRVIQTLKKTDFLLKNDMRNRWILMQAVENLSFDGLVMSKACNAWAKKIHRSWTVRMSYGFKNYISKLVNFHASSWK